MAAAVDGAGVRRWRALPTDPGEFRGVLRAWLTANPPPQRRAWDVQAHQSGEFDLARERPWQRQLAEAGWAGISWPTEYGGRGASPSQQLIFHDELHRAG